MLSQRGNAGPNFVVIVAILIFLIFIFSGFFKDSRVLWDSFNIKSLLRLPCGITVQKPHSNTKISFPLEIGGYINQCGWIFDGNKMGGARSGGTAQVFDDKGMPITLPTSMIIPEISENYPMYFSNELQLLTPPATDTGKIVFVSTTGLIYSVSVQF